MFGGLLFENRDRGALIDAIHRSQAVASFAVDGTILSANGNFLALFGYSADEVIGRNHTMFVDPEVKSGAAYSEFWRQLRAGVYQQSEFKRLGKAGCVVYIQASYNPILGANGKPEKIVKLATNVTAATRLAMDHAGQINALGQSQCVVEFDLDGTILSANDKFLEAFGYGLEDVRGRHHRMFVDAPTPRAGPTGLSGTACGPGATRPASSSGSARAAARSSSRRPTTPSRIATAARSRS